MKRHFLGLDCSTQSLSAVIIDFDAKKIIYEKQLIFEKVFPEYHTKSGTLQKGNEVHSPPMMWVDALVRLFEEMQKEKVDLAHLLALSGSAQQHGSVYLNDSFSKSLRTMDLPGAFSRKTAPIWMDFSTTQECEEIRKGLGGLVGTVEATGSNTFERFTAAQIRKFYKTQPQNYAQTESIALVSSFMASLLSGKIAPIDYGDGSGMNLMDIRTKKWHLKALDATAPDLLEKLPPLTSSTAVIGKVNPYFGKYGLNLEALSLVWTGDNPSSMVGLGLIEEGMTGISLGTSFTHFGCIKECFLDPKGEGHLFVSPTGDYMTLNCFLNGALAIQKMREFYHIDWPTFNHHLETTKPGNGGALLLPYFDHEIVPKVLKPRLHRRNLKEGDVAANCRALIEGQLMAMRNHSHWMHLKPKEIYVTGGVSNNLPILQILADIFDCKILRCEVPKSTALGAALRAAFAYFGKKSWKEIVEGFTDPILAATPQSPHIYPPLCIHYHSFETEVLAN